METEDRVLDERRSKQGGESRLQAMQPSEGASTAAFVRERCEALRRRIHSVVHVDARILDGLVMALLARGHVLLEGIPGIGKTLLARTLARCIDASFTRIQFTNDLMPSDIVGSVVWRQRAEHFEFVRGPLFSNLVLADEINRTSPRTLSCLLEAMENGRVTVEGKSLQLAEPFSVLATRNPIEFHGTYPIPEAALDRFLMRLELGYPSPEHEVALYQGDAPETRLAALEPVLSIEQLVAMQEATLRVRVENQLARYVHRFVVATREADGVALGASPRAALSWLSAARAQALMSGRDYVIPDDLKRCASAVLAHRIFLHGGADANDLVQDLLTSVRVEL